MTKKKGKKRKGFTWSRKGWVITNKGRQSIPIDKGVPSDSIVPVYCRKLDAEIEVRHLDKEELRPCRIIIEVEGD